MTQARRSWHCGKPAAPLGPREEPGLKPSTSFLSLQEPQAKEFIGCACRAEDQFRAWLSPVPFGSHMERASYLCRNPRCPALILMNNNTSVCFSSSYGPRHSLSCDPQSDTLGSDSLLFLDAPHSLQDLSSPTRDRTRALAVSAPGPNHWTSREFPGSDSLIPILQLGKPRPRHACP